LNILRIKDKIEELKRKDFTGNKKKMKKRYMLFIDLKQAFDCVDYSNQ
jgi:hypothetical protein